MSRKYVKSFGTFDGNEKVIARGGLLSVLSQHKVGQLFFINIYISKPNPKDAKNKINTSGVRVIF